MDILSILPLLLGGGDTKELLLKLLQQKMGGDLGGFGSMFGGNGQKTESAKSEPSENNNEKADKKTSTAPVASDFPFEKTDLIKPQAHNEQIIKKENITNNQQATKMPSELQKSIYDLLPRLLSIKR